MLAGKNGRPSWWMNYYLLSHYPILLSTIYYLLSNSTTIHLTCYLCYLLIIQLNSFNGEELAAESFNGSSTSHSILHFETTSNVQRETLVPEENDGF